MNDMLREIGKQGIDSVLLEGGETLISRAFSEKVIDGGEIFISNKIFGDNNAKSFISGFMAENTDKVITLDNIKYNVYDNNIGVEFYLKRYDERWNLVIKYICSFAKTFLIKKYLFYILSEVGLQI